MKFERILLVCLSLIAFAAGQERILAAKLRATNCGRRRVIEGDTRTLTPWNAVIFFKADENSVPKYFTTGAIIGPTTILTVAPGPLGGPLRGSYEEDKLYPAAKFTVGVGLNSTSFSSGDRFTQFAQVYYLEPYLHHGAGNEHYHLLLYHLKTILDLKTPYARAVCLVPRSTYEFLLPILDRGAYPSGHIGGFTTTLSSSGSFNYNLRQDISVIETPGYCSRILGFHYKRKSLEELRLFCVKKLKREVSGNSSLSFNDVIVNLTTELSKPVLTLRKNAVGNVSETCYVHGSIAVFSFNERFCINGLTALIPGRRRDRCNDETIYVMAETGYYYDWLSKAVDCSPNKYYCGDADAICIPVSKVCNGIKDCPNGQDENEALCHAQNTCEAGNYRQNKTGSRIVKQHFCGITDICIPLKNVCDATADCEEGGDELQERCGIKDEDGEPLEGATEAKNCTLPLAPSGTFARCFDPSNRKVSCGNETLPTNYSIEFSCKPFYVPYYDYAFVRQKCMENGSFRRTKPFSCTRECGTYESGDKGTIEGGFTPLEKLDRNMPWNSLIFSPPEDATDSNFPSAFTPICSAVLIDVSFLLTSVSCLTNMQNEKAAMVLEPTSTTYNESLLYTKASYNMHWISDSGNQLSDLAVIKITSPRGNAPNGIVPCFLNNPKYFARAPSVNTIGWMTRFTSELELSAAVNYDLNENDDAQAGSHLYGYQGRVRPGSECGDINSGAKMSNYTFCVAIVMDERSIDTPGTNLGVGFYTGIAIKNSTRVQYSLKGISVSQASLSFRESSDPSKVTFYQWFTGVELFSDWIVDVLERNY